MKAAELPLRILLHGGAVATFSTINPVWVSGFNQTDATTMPQ
jgi:hypothetical protein